MAVLSNSQYTGLTETNQDIYNHEVIAKDIVDEIINQVVAEAESPPLTPPGTPDEPKTIKTDDTAQRLNDQNEKLMEIIQQTTLRENTLLEKMEAMAEEMKELKKERKTATKKMSPKKPKSVSEKKNGGGANLNNQEKLQKAGSLAPFRDGGCRCRTWGARMGTQCSRTDTGNGFCEMHTKRMEKDNGWKLGFYDEVRPQVWGENGAGLAKHEKKGNKIGWSMPQDIFLEAFERDVKNGLLNADPVPEDDGYESDDTLPLPDDEEQEEVEIVVNNDTAETQIVQVNGKIGECYTCSDGTKSVKTETLDNGRIECFCQKCHDSYMAEDSDSSSSDEEDSEEELVFHE
jgi:hypothetical protein